LVVYTNEAESVESKGLDNILEVVAVRVAIPLEICRDVEATSINTASVAKSQC
jgi:hypothetical protein